MSHLCQAILGHLANTNSASPSLLEVIWALSVICAQRLQECHTERGLDTIHLVDILRRSFLPCRRLRQPITSFLDTRHRDLVALAIATLVEIHPFRARQPALGTMEKSWVIKVLRSIAHPRDQIPAPPAIEAVCSSWRKRCSLERRSERDMDHP